MRLSRRAALLLPGLAAATLLPVRLRAAPDDAALRALNRSLVEQAILPGYRQFTSVTANLTARLDALAKEPDAPQTLDLARRGFADTMLAWQAVQPIRFGPADLFSRHARIQSWPDPQDQVGRDLTRAIAARDTTLLETRPNALGHITTQGLSALEWLLFGEDAAQLLSSGDAEAGYRAALIRAAGGNLAALGRDLLAGWTGGENPQASVMIEPRPPFATLADATLELLRALHGAVAGVADRKLGPALGASAAEARPRLLECWRSGLSGQAIRANLETARAMLGAGILAALDGNGQAPLAAELRQAAEVALASASSLPLPLEAAIADEARRPVPLQLQAQAVALRDMLARRLPPALGLTLPAGGLEAGRGAPAP